MAFFHSLGYWHTERDLLSSLVRDGTMDGAASFNILGLIKSGPVAFEVSRHFKISLTSDSEIFMLERRLLV